MSPIKITKKLYTVHQEEENDHVKNEINRKTYTK